MRATLTRLGLLAVSLMVALGVARSTPTLVGYVEVTPDGTITPARPPNSGPYSASFVVTNTDPGPGQTEDFSITCGGGGGVTCTGVSHTSVSLAPGQYITVTATYTVPPTESARRFNTMATSAGWLSCCSAGQSAARLPPGGALPSSELQHKVQLHENSLDGRVPP